MTFQEAQEINNLLIKYGFKYAEYKSHVYKDDLIAIFQYNDKTVNNIMVSYPFRFILYNKRTDDRLIQRYDSTTVVLNEGDEHLEYEELRDTVNKYFSKLSFELFYDDYIAS